MASLLKKIKGESNILSYNNNCQLNLIKTNSVDIKSFSENSCKVKCEYTLNDDLLNDYVLKNKYKVLVPIKHKQGKGIFIVKSENHEKFIFKIEDCKYTNKFITKILTLINETDNEYIIKQIDSGNYDNYCYYIYPYFEGNNLSEFLKYNEFLSENIIKKIFNKIVYGVKYLHSLNIIHCDLKLENILINDNHEIKIIDYDLSIICPDKDGYVADRIFGTKQYIAPESHDLNIYSKKSDVWQIGVILYYMILRKFPYKNDIILLNSSRNLYRKNIFKHINLNHLKKSLCNKYSEELIDLLKKMLIFNESNRISIDEILDSDWLKKIE